MLSCGKNPLEIMHMVVAHAYTNIHREREDYCYPLLDVIVKLIQPCINFLCSLGTFPHNVSEIKLVAMTHLETERDREKNYSAVGCTSDCRSRDFKFQSQPGHIISVEFDDKILSVAFLLHYLPTKSLCS